MHFFVSKFSDSNWRIKIFKFCANDAGLKKPSDDGSASWYLLALCVRRNCYTDVVVVEETAAALLYGVDNF